MGYLKALGVSVISAAALMASVGVGTASAEGILCSVEGTGTPTGTTCPSGKAYGAGTVIQMVNVGNVLLHDAEGHTIITCKQSTVQGTTETETTPEGPVEALKIEECDQEMKVLKNGRMQVHWISGTHNGTLTSNGAEVTLSINFGLFKVHCIYVTTNTSLGDVTGGNPAIFHTSATLEELATSALCAAKAKLTATYEVTSAKPLFIAGHT